MKKFFHVFRLSSWNSSLRLSSWSRSLRLSSWRGVASIGSIAFLFAACGDEVTTNPDTGNVVNEIENASISGVSQKGPFVKGATVTAFELDGSKSLLQTGRTFVGNITQDEGRFNMSNVTLKSSYVRLSVNGYYRNEVSGKNSTAPITLNAVTDLDARNTVNVNLLTHLEYDRVAHLMAQGDGTLKIKKLKKQAEGEIFKAFHFDDLADFGYSEDLDVFGKTDADAALLAISILLQGDRSESELTALLTDFSNDFKDGTWDSAQVKAEIADWALEKDYQNKLATYRTNVKGWGLSATVPDFEKYIRRFASVENGLGVCGSDSTPVGTVKQVKNAKSTKYYAASYTAQNNKTRFICIDSTGVGKMWRVATDLEKDRFNWNPKNTKDGALLDGPFTGEKMVWDADTLRYAKNSEIRFSLGCASYNKGFFQKTAESDYAEYGFVCKENSEWDSYVTIQRIESKYGKIKDERDGKSYYTITIGEQTWMAENLSFDYKVKGSTYGTYSNTDNGETYGRYYTWAAAMDSAGLYSTNSAGCGYGKTCTVKTPARGICPEGWHIPTSNEWNTLYSAIGSSPYAMQAKGYWSDPKDTYGFSALPAGRCYHGSFNDVGSYARFWSATENYSQGTYSWNLDASGANLINGINGNYKYDGYSVRCLKDSEE